jgi:hypothetical protein
LEATATLGVFAWALEARDLTEARNLAFSTLVFGELFRAFAARSQDRIFWEVGAFTNLRLLGVVVVSVFLQLGLHHIPWTQELFKVGDLPLADCALALGVGLIPVSILELTKLARRLWRRGKPENRVLPRLGSGWRGREPGHATTGPAGVAGHCESANLSRRVAINLLHSQCERLSGTVRVGESVPVAHPESVREWLGLRSHSPLVAKRRRGLVNRSPQGTCRGGFVDLALEWRGLAFVGGERGDAGCADKEWRLTELGVTRTAGALSLRPLGREKQRAVNNAVNR